MAKTPLLQARVHLEVDALSARLDREQREMHYADLQRLPLLSRVLTETLRLWPSVPNGLFRELDQPQVVKGRDGASVELPQGTNVQVPIWLMHMSKELWGPSAEEFDPDRDFLPDEVWHGKPLGATNPYSHRFMPFSTPPRDCVGRNFSMMEACIILYALLSRFHFELAEPTKSRALTSRERRDDFLAMTSVTMSPREGMFVVARERRPSRL